MKGGEKNERREESKSNRTDGKKYDVLNAVDKTILGICKSIQEGEILSNYVAETIKALALLGMARAFISNS